MIADGALDEREGVTSYMYTTEQGDKLFYEIREYESEKEAQHALEKLMNNAEKVIEVGVRFDLGSQLQGRRVVLVRRVPSKDELEHAIAWTKGSEVWSIRAPRRADILEFEKELEEAQRVR
jgi:hypothetical protein